MTEDEPISNRVLARKHLEGLSFAELARMTGLTPRQVRIRIGKHIKGVVGCGTR